MSNKMISKIQSKYPRVSIIIVNLDKKDYLLKCIKSIIKTTKYPRYYIIVVDKRLR